MHSDNRELLSTLIYHRQKKAKTVLNIIALDTSGSTLKSEQLKEAKAVVQSLCDYFYQQRQRLALLCFGNQRCHWLIIDSKIPLDINQRLNAIQAGGGTPLRQALLDVQRYMSTVKRSDPTKQQKLFVITDGRSRDKIDDIQLDSTIECYVLDSESSSIKLNKARDLAMHLQANYVFL